jgi:hypothetical protein
LPEAIFYRARTGLTAQNVPENFMPDLLVWAVGGSRMESCQWPDENWKPKMILDLNYTENSPGREYALKVGARYISGAQFFKEQAKHQRAFWQKLMDQAALREVES